MVLNEAPEIHFLLVLIAERRNLLLVILCITLPL